MGAKQPRQVRVFRHWMAAGTGCAFASNFATKKGLSSFQVFVGGLSANDLKSMATTIDEDGRAKRMSFVVFPRLRETTEVHALIKTLATSSRWQTSEVQWRNHRRAGSLIWLGWQTPEKRLFSVMGFAPFGCMPATRRAPYVALAIWGGGFDNDLKQGKAKNESALGLIDVAPRMKARAYKRAMDTTNATVKDLLSDPPEDIEHLRGVAFCLHDDQSS